MASVPATDIAIPLGDAALEGLLSQPAHARGVVVFVHGSGSSRFSRRNQAVAGALNTAGFATLLFDLLTPEEHAEDTRTRALRFDIHRLAARTVATVDWLGGQSWTRGLHFGLFGASTGAAAALVAAAERPDSVAAVVSRGGRPDLAGDALARVQAPVRLIVGGLDTTVIEYNQAAAARLRAEHRLDIVPGASHLFEEPGTLDAAAALARDWFQRFLARD